MIANSCPIGIECPAHPCPNLPECDRVSISLDLAAFAEARIEEAEPYSNPFSLDPDENWSPPGTQFVNGELVIIDNFY